MRGAAMIIVAGLALAVSGPAALAKCERSDYQIEPSKNETVEVTMTASAGMDCVLRLGAGRRYTVTDRRIVEAPSFGKATIEGQTVFYRGRPGYAGPDRFVAAVSAKAWDGQGTSRIVVNVTVE